MTNVSPSQRPDRLAHPRVDLRRTRVLQVDVAHRAGVLVGDEERRLALEDLEGERHVGGARHARQVALDLRVAGQPLRLVLVLLLAGLGQVGNLAADHDADARRHGADRAEGDHFLGRHRHHRPGTHRQRRTGGVRFEVPVGGVQGLPDPVQIGLAVGGARHRGAGRLARDRQGGDGEGCAGGGREQSGDPESDDAVTHCGDLPRHPDARIGAEWCQADERARDA